MNDKSIAAFLAARRKFIAGALSIVGILSADHLLPVGHASMIVQAIIGFMGAYGIHEVANDQYTNPPTLAG